MSNTPNSLKKNNQKQKACTNSSIMLEYWQHNYFFLGFSEIG